MKEAVKYINDANSIYIYAHINMDGDAMGSTSALCCALKSIGKDAHIVISEEIPHYLDFLEKGNCVTPEEVPSEYDLAMMLDCGSYSRIVGREEAWERGLKHGCIDHHALGNSDVEFDFAHVEPDAAATGELVFKLIRELGIELNLDIAESLWTAITTDTGNFQHNSTNSFTHEVAAAIHSVPGFDSSVISALLYQRKSVPEMKLHARVLSDIRFYADDKIAIAAATSEMFEETGADYANAGDIIDTLRALESVEVAVILKEAEPGKFRVSMRAKSYVNVAEVALKFGGGGHVRAAGCPISGTLDEVRETLASELIKAVEK